MWLLKTVKSMSLESKTFYKPIVNWPSGNNLLPNIQYNEYLLTFRVVFYTRRLKRIEIEMDHRSFVYSCHIDRFTDTFYV